MAIPKIIHYCWFGGNPLPVDAQKCIDSWQKYLPDYEIKEWNETNFDVRCCPYVSEAYEQRKYAFVSDYARMWVLYHHGGLYFDTDVELIKPLDDILEHGSFMGCEAKSVSGEVPEKLSVNPGLGIAAETGMQVYADVMEVFHSLHFVNPDGSLNIHGIVPITTSVLCRHGLKNVPHIQEVSGITIYPQEYFNPMDSTTGIITLAENTVSIHHYSCSWMDQKSLRFRLHKLKNRLIKIFGAKVIIKFSRILAKFS